MSSEDFTTRFDPGQTVYPRFQNSAGQVFDWDDESWKSEASVVDPVPSSGVSEVATLKGDQSLYKTTIDLLKLNATLSTVNVWTMWVRQLGASPNLSIDEEISTERVDIIRAGRLNPVFTLKYQQNQKLDEPNTPASFWLSLLDRGEFVDLGDVSPAPGITIDIRKEGEGADLFQATAASPDASGSFYLTYDNPGFGADPRLFKATINIGSGALIVHDFVFGAT